MFREVTEPEAQCPGSELKKICLRGGSQMSNSAYRSSTLRFKTDHCILLCDVTGDSNKCNCQRMLGLKTWRS